MAASSLRRGSIRFRITALATLLVAVVLISGAIGLVAIQRQQLHSNLDASLEQRADAYEEAFAQDDSDDALLLNSNDEDRAVQLVGEGGQVITATPNLAGADPLPDPLGSDGEQTFRNGRHPQLEDDEFRFLARRIDVESGPATLHVAQNTDDLNDVVRGLAIALGVAVPLALLLLAALIWWLVGRTLQPVEAIRAEVAEISRADQQRRVPVADQADEVAQLATTMNEMLDRIDNAARRQRQFLADASHELRTPLTRIRTEVEVDISQPESANPVATNRAVLQESIALQQLLDDLLFLARSDEHAAPARIEPTDFDDIVLHEVERIRSDSDVTIDIADVSGAHLVADPNQLARVVRNLLSNALRHAESTVAISLVEDGEVVRLTITDDGPGVPPDARDRIFERFGRADAARTRSDGGAGLGLAITRDIVERHEGHVFYDDSWTGGARFVVEFPTSAPS